MAKFGAWSLVNFHPSWKLVKIFTRGKNWPSTFKNSAPFSVIIWTCTESGESIRWVNADWALTVGVCTVGEESIKSWIISHFLILSITTIKRTELSDFWALILSDKIMMRLNKIPWESITLPILKYWCDFLMFENILYIMIMAHNTSKNLMNVVKSVDLKVFILFFRGPLCFKKMFMIFVLKYNIPLKKNLKTFRFTDFTTFINFLEVLLTIIIMYKIFSNI